jgi:hypothetical protein
MASCFLPSRQICNDMTVLYTLDSLQKARRPSAGGNYTYRQPLQPSLMTIIKFDLFPNKETFIFA